MRLSRLGLIAASTVVAVGLAACGGSSSDSGGESGGGGEATTLKLGFVPSTSQGVIQIGIENGYFAEEGITLETLPVDSGPNVITGVVAQQYDIGFVNPAPALIAASEGAPICAVTGDSTVGPAGQNMGTLVRKDSGITDYKGLQGKPVAANAPRSVIVIGLQGAIQAEGGDGLDVEIVPLPFNQIAKAVADGQVEGGLILEPFLSGALKEFPDLVNLGDPMPDVLKEGTAYGTYVTNNATWESKKSALEGFQRAFAKSVETANADLAQTLELGAKAVGIPPEAAAAIKLSTFRAEITPADLEPYNASMTQFQWVKQAPDLNKFVCQ